MNMLFTSQLNLIR